MARVSFSWHGPEMKVDTGSEELMSYHMKSYKSKFSEPKDQELCLISEVPSLLPRTQ
jgi:hypothetical protein